MTGRGTHRQDVYSSTSPRATVAVLGPSTVTVDGVERTITARRQRAVLICLALHTAKGGKGQCLCSELVDPHWQVTAHNQLRGLTAFNIDHPDFRGIGHIGTVQAHEDQPLPIGAPKNGRVVEVGFFG